MFYGRIIIPVDPEKSVSEIELIKNNHKEAKVLSESDVCIELTDKLIDENEIKETDGIMFESGDAF